MFGLLKYIKLIQKNTNIDMVVLGGLTVGITIKIFDK